MNELVKSEPKNEIVVYQPNETMRLEVRVADESAWLTQAKIGELFVVDRTVINRHIHNVYNTGELMEAAICAKIAQVQTEGGRKITRLVSFYAEKDGERVKVTFAAGGTKSFGKI